MGCVTIPLNYRLTGSELSFIIENANPAALIMGEEFNSLAHELKARLKKLDILITIGKDTGKDESFDQLVS